jgi:hypothetical protein
MTVGGAAGMFIGSFVVFMPRGPGRRWVERLPPENE